MLARSNVLLGVAQVCVAWTLAACQAPRASTPTDPSAAPRSIDGSEHVHAEAWTPPPFALFVAELGADALGVALVAPDGSTVLAGEWSRSDERFHAHSLTLLGRFAVELATAPERTFDLTQELAPEAVVALVDLGGSAHRAAVLGGFEGDARTAADQLALAAASFGSLLARTPAVRALGGADGGTRGGGVGYFRRACAEHARCYALSAEPGGVRSALHAEPLTRKACDAQLLDELRAEATSESEPFVELVHAAACAYGWRAWPATAGR